MARVLVVEDDPETLETLGRLFTRLGHQVVLARDGVEAMKRLSAEPIDLLFTDLVMPDQDGLGLIREVKRDQPGLLIIAFSGAGVGGPVDYLKAARLIGADATLAKPFSTEEMIEAVERVLSG